MYYIIYANYVSLSCLFNFARKNRNLIISINPSLTFLLIFTFFRFKKIIFFEGWLFKRVEKGESFLKKTCTIGHCKINNARRLESSCQSPVRIIQSSAAAVHQYQRPKSLIIVRGGTRKLLLPGRVALSRLLFIEESAVRARNGNSLINISRSGLEMWKWTLIFLGKHKASVCFYVIKRLIIRLTTFTRTVHK